MSDGLRVMIADREATRAGIRMALEGRVEVCAEVGDLESAVRSAMREQPDLCLVGSDLRGDGVSAVRGISRAAPNAAIVLLAQRGDIEDLLVAVRAGAIGYVPGPLTVEKLQRVVQAVSANEAVVPRSMVHELLLELRNSGGGREGISNREVQVLGLLRRGHSTAQIAEKLDIAPVTVRRHISELVRKLGLEDRSELIGSRALRPGHRHGALASVQRS